ncbi:restriction endonuclease [Shimia thalassica]|uniref:nSTAND3 domain-containing NTPase n=1 Tax=Shimia thalassica TaxID=1715693 RepID=UPI0024950EFE|nr:restriction endonuclease [Shimia thalassica]
MADYDFSTLSPIDFEKLVNDLVQANEGVRVQRFGVGRDGGIDGRFAAFEGNGIVQAKHYRASSFSQLKASLRKSKDQVLGHAPARYILCTSQDLSPDRKDELVAELLPINIVADDVWCREDLNALIDAHPEIEKSHIKLWLNSSGVLERFLNNETTNRSEAFLSELQRANALFVAHEGYTRAQKVIDHQKVLIVAGPPGVGKTTLSLVVAARYLEDDWELVAVNSIAEALKVFSTKRKQVFIFDDFLGAIKLDKDALSKGDSDLRRFVEAVRRHSNTTRFILTTRKYIYEEARLASETLADEALQMSDVVLELRTYTEKIKSEILYNHLFFSDLSEDYLSALVRSGLLSKIIGHKNYMPRIIEWLTEGFRLSGCAAEDYPSHFLATLDRPNQIWHHAVQEHLDQKARTLLRCLFFVPDFTGIDRSFVDWFDESINLLAQRLNFSVSERELSRTLRVLEGSFVEVFGRRITFVNPSLRDYLNADLSHSTTLGPLAECIQNRNQVLWMWRFIKSEGDRIGGTNVVFRALAERCLIPNTTVSGQVSLYDFLNFAHEAATILKERAFCDLVATERFANSLDLDIYEMPKLFEELDLDLYELPDVQAFREYLRERFISELSQTQFDAESGSVMLQAAEEHPDYLEEDEHEALVEMADSVIARTSMPDVGDVDSDWTNLEEQLEILERWASDPHVRYLKSQVDDYLTELEHARQASEDQAEEEYRLYGPRHRASSYGPAGHPRQNTTGETEYRAVFESLLSPTEV